MPDEQNYECPHCGQVTSVARALLGQTVACSLCGKSFQAAPPVGRPVDSPVRPGASAPRPAKPDGEVTLLAVHPVIFRSHLVFTALCTVAGALGLMGLVLWATGRTLFGTTSVVMAVCSLVLLAVPLAAILTRWVQAKATTLTVTTQRTVLTKGIISRSTNEVQHDDIRNLRCDQNILERLFNYGDIGLSTSGQDDLEIVVDDLPDPQAIIALIRQHQ